MTELAEGTAVGGAKGAALPLKRTKKQIATAAKRAAEAQAAADLAVAQDAKKAQAARLAQVVNLHIAGFSLAEIGASIGATEAEVDRMLMADTARYVKTQPALRTYVRNYVSGKYTELLDNVWARATDAGHEQNLDAQDRALRILDRMARLHGAEAPVQKEVKIESAPEAVEKLVSAISAAQGLGYDADIFDVVDAELVHEAVLEGPSALEAAAGDVEKVSGNGDDDL